MVFMKYVLSRTGFFPGCEPDVSDVLSAVRCVQDLKNLHDNRGVWYWYVKPKVWNAKSVMHMMRLFRANGVFLRPHRSKNYNEWFLVVRDRNQHFINDVDTVYRNPLSITDVKEHRKKEIAKRRENFDNLQRFLGRAR